MWVCRTMPTFEYRPEVGRFSSLLLRVVHCRMVDALRREGPYVQMGTDSGSDSGTAWDARVPDATGGGPCVSWERLWQKRLFGEALENVRSRIDAVTFRSFQLYVLDERPVSEVMETVGIRDKNAVYQHKNRVLRYLRDEIRSLEKELDLGIVL